MVNMTRIDCVVNYIRLNHKDGEWAANYIDELRLSLLRIGQPGNKIVYCRDGHEDAVLIARATLENDAYQQ